MAKGLGLRALLAVAGVALGLAAAGPARAQYFSPGYPAVIAVPPPAQGMVDSEEDPARGSASGRSGAAYRTTSRRRTTPAATKVGRGFASRPADPAYCTAGAYWMPPLSHSSFRPRGIPSLVCAPTLRSKISP